MSDICLFCINCVIVYKQNLLIKMVHGEAVHQSCLIIIHAIIMNNLLHFLANDAQEHCKNSFS